MLALRPKPRFANTMSTLQGRLASNYNTLGGPLAHNAGVFEKYNTVASSGGVVGNMVAGLWQTFEFATVTVGNLAANDNNASAVWTIVGTTPTTSATGERATISTVNSTADTGTLGLAVDNNTGGSLKLDLLTYPTTQSVGFWVKTAPTNGTYNPIYSLGETGGEGSSICYVRCTNTAGTLSFTLTGSTTSAGVTVSSGTFYWLTLKIVKTGTCLLRVYDTTGSLVGSEQSVTGNTFNSFYHGIGGGGTSIGTTYYDDLVIDYATAAFPFGP